MSLRVVVAVALPGREELIELELPEGSSAGDAIAAARMASRFPDLGEPAAIGVWSKPVKPEALLRDGDRVEVYRPLKADAKAMRRARAKVRPSPRSRNGP